MTTLIDARSLQPGIASPQVLTEWPKGTAITVEEPHTSEGPGHKQPASWVVLESRVPAAITIGSLLDDRLRLSRPLSITIEREGEFFIANCGILEEFGYGHDHIWAVDDLRQTLSELYWSLKASPSLAPGMSSLWQELQEMIEER